MREVDGHGRSFRSWERRTGIYGYSQHGFWWEALVDGSEALLQHDFGYAGGGSIVHWVGGNAVYVPAR
jgi:hypothetical protein